MKVALIVGARPNFMKIAPIVKAINKRREAGDNSIEFRLIHTGQHYNKELSDSFFKDLEIPEPDVNLEVGSGSHAVQTAKIMMSFEEYLLKEPCDLVLVVGDVNSTIAASLVAKKLQIKVAHVEAGLRSYDMSMPEEINRLLTDAISDYYFTTTKEAGDNLLTAGAKPEQIYLVGNTMIDTLLGFIDRIERPAILDEKQLNSGEYLVLTLHRPGNVDDVEKLKYLLDLILAHTKGAKLIFPVHPRTAKVLESLGDLDERIVLTGPMRYLEFIYLIKNARAVVTDSGGIQEETTVLKVPCITLRPNTERPETVTVGTNELVDDLANFPAVADRLLSGNWKPGAIPELWDGKAGERIVEMLGQLD